MRASYYRYPRERLVLAFTVLLVGLVIAVTATASVCLSVVFVAAIILISYAANRARHQALLALTVSGDLLADVYLAMTGGQTNLLLEAAPPARHVERVARSERVPLPVILPDAEELALHEEWLRYIDEQAPAGCVWLQADGIGKVA